MKFLTTILLLLIFQVLHAQPTVPNFSTSITKYAQQNTPLTNSSRTLQFLDGVGNVSKARNDTWDGAAWQINSYDYPSYNSQGFVTELVNKTYDAVNQTETLYSIDKNEYINQTKFSKGVRLVVNSFNPANFDTLSVSIQTFSASGVANGGSYIGYVSNKPAYGGKAEMVLDVLDRQVSGEHWDFKQNTQALVLSERSTWYYTGNNVRPDSTAWQPYINGTLMPKRRVIVYTNAGNLTTEITSDRGTDGSFAPIFKTEIIDIPGDILSYSHYDWVAATSSWLKQSESITTYRPDKASLTYKRWRRDLVTNTMYQETEVNYDYTLLTATQQPQFSSLVVFPNPTSSVISISGTMQGMQPYQLVNQQGQIVQSGILYSGQQHIQIDQPNGLYFFRVLSESGLPQVAKIEVRR